MGLSAHAALYGIEAEYGIKAAGVCAIKKQMSCLAFPKDG